MFNKLQIRASCTVDNAVCNSKDGLPVSRRTVSRRQGMPCSCSNSDFVHLDEPHDAELIMYLYGTERAREDQGIGCVQAAVALAYTALGQRCSGNKGRIKTT